MIEPCLWQTLLSTQLEAEMETVPAGCGGSCGDPSRWGVGVPVVSIPMHFRLIIDPSLCSLGLGRRAWEWSRSWQSQGTYPEPGTSCRYFPGGVFRSQGEA